MKDENQWVGVLLLSHDEGDAGAVRLQGLSRLPGPAVEHGQRGQRRRNTSVSGHVPQLISVPVNGVVVVQLNSAANRTSHTVFCFLFSKCA